MEALSKQFPSNDFALLAVVLLLPLLGAFVNGVFGKRLGKDGVRTMALAALGGSFAASVLTFLRLPSGEGEGSHKLVWTAWHWLTLAGRGNHPISLDVTFSADAMTATMMLVVTGVGFLIHVYSSEYMKKDDGYHRFFAYLNLFCFSMLVLIMGDNLAVLFVGWEGVGLCSYLLIGFWFEDEKNATAGKKAFITNRIGDFGLLVAMALLVFYAGSLGWDGIAQGKRGLLQEVPVWPIGNLPIESVWDQQFAATSHFPSWLMHLLLPDHVYTCYASTLVGLAVFLGCAGKSAQIPLYVWLPDAMAGPTPVSALIHAATMVTAGVYLVARLSFVFVMSPFALATVAVTGAATAIFAASMGLFQKDLKKVLAYSTVSQLGFMFIGVGTGAFAAGFFHVFTHAFFKACLFLGAGSVIHAMHKRIHDTEASQDMANMGGLAKYMPITRWTFLLSCLSIAGFPGFAGFWSKDEILWKAWSTLPADPLGKTMWTWPSWLGQAIYCAGILAATMTAFYMFRAYFKTFHGEFRGWKIVKNWVDPHAGKHGHDDHAHDDHAHDEHAHEHHDDATPLEGPVPQESPLAMTLPLIVLAAFAVFAGFLGADPIHIQPLEHKIEPVFELAEKGIVLRAGVEAHGSSMWLMMVPGAIAAIVGTGIAYVVYLQGGGEGERRFERAFPGFYKLLYDKWRIDELYDATVIGMVDALADIFVMSDKWIIDGIIARLTAMVVSAIGSILRLFQTGRVQVYSGAMVVGLASLGWFFGRPHAAVVVDRTNLALTGEVVVKAAPGLGYSYRWAGEGVDKNDFSTTQTEYHFKVDPGKTRSVKVLVKNAFGLETEEPVVVTRPAPASNGFAIGDAQIKLGGAK